MLACLLKPYCFLKSLKSCTNQVCFLEQPNLDEPTDPKFTHNPLLSVVVFIIKKCTNFLPSNMTLVTRLSWQARRCKPGSTTTTTTASKEMLTLGQFFLNSSYTFLCIPKLDRNHPACGGGGRGGCLLLCISNPTLVF